MNDGVLEEENDHQRPDDSEALRRLIGDNSEVINENPRQHQTQDVNDRDNHRWILPTAIFILILALVGTKVYQRHLYTKVTAPLSAPLVMPENSTAPDSNPELFWGTYRPHIYFGVRHRSPHSLLAGLLWFEQRGQQSRLRYECRSDDDLKHYNWLLHDGRNFGKQRITEENYTVDTTFVKRVAAGPHGGDWTTRISVASTDHANHPSRVSVLFYIYLPDSSRGQIHPLFEGEDLKALEGKTEELGTFRITFHPRKTTGAGALLSHMISNVPREDHIRQTVFSGLRIFNHGMYREHVALVGHTNETLANVTNNIWVFEMTATAGEFHLEVEYRSHSGDTVRPALVGAQLGYELDSHVADFETKFARVFPLDRNKYSQKQIEYAKSALSNLLGGVGYFYGSSVVTTEHMKPDSVPYWAAPLFTATPSRAQFPRGFLWDEGFHGLLLARWDTDLALESVGHWLDLMNAEGWIPREQILGWEAKARVPAEFVVQNNQYGNPPALVMVIEDILDNWSRLDEGGRVKSRQLLLRTLPRLTAWFNWFNRTQVGPLPSSYRWRGRDTNNTQQLNPTTLTSGLNDYPRASHPSADERHLDLRCWMAVFARVMVKLWERLGGPQEKSKDVERYAAWYRQLTDEDLLNQLHWSEQLGHYADYGQHTDRIHLVRMQQQPDQPKQKLEIIRLVQETPQLQFVPAFGYVSLFPLLLRLLPTDSTHLAKLFISIRNNNLLWTEFGLRSLSRQTTLYQRHNTEHDPPYWRGSIWVNMNYLAVSALRHYAQVPSRLQEAARHLAEQLSDNVIQSILHEFERTGFLWEQYDDETGQGLRAHPYSGGTSLVLLMMTDSGITQ